MPNGKLLKVFREEGKEGENDWRHSYSLDELGLTRDGEDGSALVEFRVKDLKKPPKQWDLSHVFVGEEVRPLGSKLRTVMIGGDPHSVRGWRVKFSRRGPRKKDGTEEEMWLPGANNCNAGSELRSDIEDRDEKSAFGKAKKLVRDSFDAPPRRWRPRRWRPPRPRPRPRPRRRPRRK